MNEPPKPATSFAALALSAPILKALGEIGYEAPSPIQAATIPALLEGRDLIGQAQTGTGKTAAFALPALQGIDPQLAATQCLVLVPTRELAIQVAEAFQSYAAHLKGFRVLPIYGGQAYGGQLHGLRRGAHVVIATPGRLIDHLQRGSLDLSQLRLLVLDEADEMLRMGFIDDVETILEASPADRQLALFSATLPPRIRQIAAARLRDPVQVSIASKVRTATTIRQRYWLVRNLQKLDALTRLLEVEPFEAMLIFVRTKQASEVLADRLQARGLAASAIHGDFAQPQRERIIERLRDGQIDILVATDVAARGLDVERISHVLNYDIPYDAESYVHRIGRTGRAGRSGEAILFVTPRERGMLRAIERMAGERIEPMAMPTSHEVNDQRVARFRERIDAVLTAPGPELDTFRHLLAEYERSHDDCMLDIAAALACMAQGDVPLLLPPDRAQPEAEARPAPAGAEKRRFEPGGLPPRRHRREQPDFETYRIAVGHRHQVRPGNIVGAIANEAGIDSRFIGRIDIREDHSYIDLPPDLPQELLQHLRKVWVAGQKLAIRPHEGPVPPAPPLRRGGSYQHPPRRQGAPPPRRYTRKRGAAPPDGNPQGSGPAPGQRPPKRKSDRS